MVAQETLSYLELKEGRIYTRLGENNRVYRIEGKELQYYSETSGYWWCYPDNILLNQKYFVHKEPASIETPPEIAHYPAIIRERTVDKYIICLSKQLFYEGEDTTDIHGFIRLATEVTPIMFRKSKGF